MSIICYPRDDVDFVASDAGAFFATRTSGVYSADGNLAVSINAARQLSVSSGIAWIRTDSYWGKVVVNTADIYLTLPDADGVLDRICRVVARWDKTANELTIILRNGELSTTPVAPARNTSDELFELVLADYLVEHGETAASAARLTDQRLNEDLCGLMSDGVTGIPTASLEAQAEQLIQNIRDAFDAVISLNVPAHAATHASGGTDRITPVSIGAATPEQLHYKNLLDNWDFRNPVNQRGFASGASTTINGTYFVDRWNGVGTATWTQGSGITLAETTTFVQYMEIDYHELLGKTCTVSMVVGGELETAALTFPAEVNGATVYNDATIAGLCTVRLGFNYVSAGSLICGVSQQYVPYFRIDALSTFTIERVKVESGNVSTLMLDAPMDYASMLMICKRYYYRLENGSGAWVPIGVAHGRSATVCQWTHRYSEMRSAPTITVNNLSSLSLASPGGADKAPTSCTVNNPKTTCFSMIINIASGGAVNQAYELWFRPDPGSIECSAEIL